MSLLRRSRSPISAETHRRLARLFVLGLGAARVGAGMAQVVAPRVFLTSIGAPEAPAQTQMGFRMKGGRDVAMGLMTWAARGDDDRLAEIAMAAVVIDLVDGSSVVLDRGRTLGPPADPLGAVLGFGVAAAAWWAARGLR
ncbi:hypothetical protein BH23ACT9_BH23ACT9_21460 [soil metagenome]